MNFEDLLENYFANLNYFPKVGLNYSNLIEREYFEVDLNFVVDYNLDFPMYLVVDYNFDFQVYIIIIAYKDLEPGYKYYFVEDSY